MSLSEAEQLAAAVAAATAASAEADDDPQHQEEDEEEEELDEEEEQELAEDDEEVDDDQGEGEEDDDMNDGGNGGGGYTPSGRHSSSSRGGWSAAAAGASMGSDGYPRESSNRTRRPSALVREAQDAEAHAENLRLQNREEKIGKKKLQAATKKDHLYQNKKGGANIANDTFVGSAVSRAPLPHALIVYHEVDKNRSSYYMVPIVALSSDDTSLLNSLHGSGVNKHALAHLAFDRLLRKAAFKHCLGSPLEFGKEYVMQDLRAENQEANRQRRQRTGKGFHNMWVDKLITNLYDISFITDERPIVDPNPTPATPVAVKTERTHRTPTNRSENKTAKVVATAVVVEHPLQSSAAAVVVPVPSNISLPVPAAVVASGVPSQALPATPVAHMSPDPPMVARSILTAEPGSNQHPLSLAAFPIATATGVAAEPAILDPIPVPADVQFMIHTTEQQQQQQQQHQQQQMLQRENTREEANQYADQQQPSDTPVSDEERKRKMV